MPLVEMLTFLPFPSIKPTPSFITNPYNGQVLKNFQFYDNRSFVHTRFRRKYIILSCHVPTRIGATLFVFMYCSCITLTILLKHNFVNIILYATQSNLYRSFHEYVSIGFTVKLRNLIKVFSVYVPPVR